tara:strand:- start:5077 stop:7671 length:2595 start_codon:yes stop_codon:yes gene_type:complete
MVTKTKPKYKRTYGGFKPLGESLAFQPKQTYGDQIVKLMRENQAIEEKNFQRTQSQGVVNIDLEYQQQNVLDRHNDRILTLNEKMGEQNWKNIQHLTSTAFTIREAVDKAQGAKKATEDIVKLRKLQTSTIPEEQELYKNIINARLTGEKINDKTINEMQEFAFVKKLEGEPLSLVKNIINASGYREATFAKLNLNNVINNIPAWYQQQMDFKVEPNPYMQELGIPEAINLADISKGGKYHDLIVNKDVDNRVLGYLQAEARNRMDSVLSKWYDPATVLSKIDPVVDDLIGYRSILDAKANEQHYNSYLRNLQIEKTISDIGSQKPGVAAKAFANSVKTDSLLNGGDTSKEWQNKFEHIVQAVIDRKITVSKAFAMIDAELVKSDDLPIPLEKTTIREWRAKDLEAINFFERIDAAQIEAAERAKVERDNSISFIQAEISAHQKANLENPDNQMILEWCKEIVSSGNSGGLTVRKLFQEATKDLGDPDQSTIDDQKSEVQSMFDLGGPINPEALAGRFDPQVTKWAADNNMVGKSEWELKPSELSEIKSAVKDFGIDTLKVQGEFDKRTSRHYISVNGVKFIEKRFKELVGKAESREIALHDAKQDFLKDLQENPNKWTVAIRPDDKVRENTENALRQYRASGYDSTQTIDIFKDRYSHLIEEMKKGKTITPNMTYIGSDGNRYKFFDETFNKVAGSTRLSKTEFLEKQFEGLGVGFNRKGQLKILNADRATQFLLERNQNDQRAQAYSSVKFGDYKGFKSDFSNTLSEEAYIVGRAPWNEILTNVDWLKVPGGTDSIINKLGLRLDDALTTKDLVNIQKRLFGLYGSDVFIGGDGENKPATLPDFFNRNPNNLYQGIIPGGTQ